MSRLGDRLSRLFGRVEILARGAEPFLRAAEVALEKGDPLDARAQARALLSRVPSSPLGLALWADAAEACGFPEEVVEALERLTEQAPWQHEVWLRLGKAGLASGWPGARNALERAATGRDAPAVTREALFALADMDLLEEPARASHWLARVPSHRSQSDAPLALRQAECAFALGRWGDAEHWVEQVGGLEEDDSERLGGRLRLMQARAAHRWPEAWVGSNSIRLAIGAYLLGAVGAERLLVQLVAESSDASLIARAREAASELGDPREPRWKAAFALAEGRHDDARNALVEAAGNGDEEAAASLASHAIAWRDMVALAAVMERSLAVVPDDVALLWRGELARREGRDEDALLEIERAWQLAGEAMAWAEAEGRRIVATWIPATTQPSAWGRILPELRRAAGAADRDDFLPRLEALAVERERPLYVAILGEFNAGKSTFINALLSTDVAPTGIRPTTATLHWVAWARDPFARVVVRGGPDRVVMHEDLKRTLDAIRADGEAVERVFIYAPVERLKRIEILDTPGFNAPDTTHGEEARRGIEEAHVALWLLDATAPLKESERQVIEEVAAAGVPIQVLVNKCDRLSESDLAEVMSYVQQALARTGIVSLGPAMAMSAQLALQGRLGGDPALLARSGWERVEALLAERIVNVADGLRETALRRKSARIATELARIAEERGRLDLDRESREAKIAQDRAQVAGLLRGERAAMADALMVSLEPTVALLERDMIPIEQLATDRTTDPEVRGYVVEKTAARFTQAFSEALVETLQERGHGAVVSKQTVASAVRGVFAGAAAAHVDRPPLRGAALVGTLTVAIVMTADAIASRDAASSRDARGRQVASLRIRALADALSLSSKTSVLTDRMPPDGGGADAGAQKVAAPTNK